MEDEQDDYRRALGCVDQMFELKEMCETYLGSGGRFMYGIYGP